MLVVLVITLMRSAAAHRWALGWVLVDLLAMSLSGGIYTWLAQTGDYHSGDVVDVGWIAGYLAVAVGAYGHADPPGRLAVPDGMAAGAHGPASAETAGPPAALAPYVPVLVALVVTAVRADGTAGRDAVEWWLAIRLVVLVVIRSLLVWVDRTLDRRAATAGAGW